MRSICRRSDSARRAGRPVSDGFRFGLAYSEAASAVDFLVREHGQEALVSLVKSYADGKADDEAFEGAIGMGVAAFGEAWLADLGVTAPVAYGPQPAAPGPQPSDWSAVPSQPVEPAGSAPAAASPTPLVGVTLPVERVELPALGLWLVALLVGGGVVLLIWTRSRRSAR